MVSVIIDTNNMLMRSLHTANGYGKPSSFEKKEDCDMLVRKIATDISYILKFTQGDFAVLCVDYSSWRKNVDIEENDGYKANRTKDSFFKWDNIFSAYNDFLTSVTSKDIVPSKIYEAEGDDMIALWADLLMNKGSHVVIVSADEDIRQLVRKQNGVYCSVYNPLKQGKNSSRKLFVEPSIYQWIRDEKPMDVFNMSTFDNDKRRIASMMGSGDVVIEDVDTSILFRKILCGDDGDNVPPIMSWKSPKGTPKRFTNSFYKKLVDIIKTADVSVFDTERTRSVEILKEALEEVTKQPILFDIKERIIRQRKLIELDKRWLPSNIVDSFDLNEAPKYDEFEKVNNFANITMTTLLKGTRFISDEYENAQKTVKREADIFKEIDKMASFNLLDL